MSKLILNGTMYWLKELLTLCSASKRRFLLLQSNWFHTWSWPLDKIFQYLCVNGSKFYGVSLVAIKHQKKSYSTFTHKMQMPSKGSGCPRISHQLLSPFVNLFLFKFCKSFLGLAMLCFIKNIQGRLTGSWLKLQL